MAGVGQAGDRLECGAPGVSAAVQGGQGERILVVQAWPSSVRAALVSCGETRASSPAASRTARVLMQVARQRVAPHPQAGPSRETGARVPTCCRDPSMVR
ncbi:hypothetical protein ADL04_03970 [Streptomyces sp. NRRL B-3648]|nr:hypothetical protein ADL04_03970 [Streptomyces sp. NRRL B-3648]